APDVGRILHAAREWAAVALGRHRALPRLDLDRPAADRGNAYRRRGCRRDALAYHRHAVRGQEQLRLVVSEQVARAGERLVDLVLFGTQLARVRRRRGSETLREPLGER